MNFVRFVLACAVLLVAPAAAATLAADTRSTTAAGTVFTAPSGWTADATAGRTVLAAPEGDFRVAVIDVPAAADAAAAAKAAWTIYDPKATRTVQLTTPMAAADGWDEKVNFSYATSPQERAIVTAVAHRRGTHWTVAIFDGAQATLEKRASGAMLALQSLRPAGYTPESYAGRTAARVDATRLTAIKAFVGEAMRQLDIPGVGLAVVDHGKIIFAGGLGVRETGKAAAVDGDTRFMIASNTKGMTTLLLARLVDQGKLSWDEPVTRAYTAFRLGSDATTAMVQIQHLVCACTGLPRKDFPIVFGGRRGDPATGTFAYLAATQPTSGFGETFQYNNLMAAAAGFVGAHVLFPDRELGAAYDAAMSREVFGPLGMTRTTFDRATILAGEDRAAPHATDLAGRTVVIDNDFNGVGYPYRPAGSAWSTPRDMARYVADELSEGVLPGGKRYVSAANLLARRKAGVAVGEASRYGMGLITTDVAGIQVVHHGGDVAGFKSDVYAIPAAGVGAVLLTNSDSGGALLAPFMRRLVEILYDGKPQAVAEVAAAAARMKAAAAQTRASLTLPPDTAAAAALAPGYANAELGKLTVARGPGDVRFAFAAWDSPVATRRNPDGSVAFVTVAPALTGFVFVPGVKDGKRTLTIGDGQHDYLYTETGE